MSTGLGWQIAVFILLLGFFSSFLRWQRAPQIFPPFLMLCGTSRLPLYYIASWVSLFAAGLKTRSTCSLGRHLDESKSNHHCISHNRPESRTEFRPSAWRMRRWSRVFIDGVVGQREVRPNAGPANVCGSVITRVSLAARRARRHRRCCLSITSVLEWKIRVCWCLQELDGKASKYHQVLMEVRLYLNKSF